MSLDLTIKLTKKVNNLTSMRQGSFKKKKRFQE